MRTGGSPRPERVPPTAAAGFVALAVALVVPVVAAAQTWTIRAAADSALASHPSMRAAEARVRAASESEAIVRSQMLPSVAGETTVTRFEEPMVVAPFHALDLTAPPDFDVTLVQSRLAVDYTLFDGGARSARIRAAEAAVETSTFRQRAAEMALLEDVVATYTDVLLSRQVEAAASRQAAALEAELDRTGRRFAEGTVARVEVMRAQAAVMDAQAALATATSRVVVAERRFARAIGVETQAVVGAPLDDVAPRQERDAATAGDPGENPLVAAARETAEEARIRVDEARASRLPSVEAAAGLQTFGAASGEFVTEWQTGVRLAWPLFTGGARSGRIDRSEAQLQAAEAESQRTEMEVADALDAAGAAALEAAARARALDSSVDRWTEVARIEALSLEEGTGVQRDYLAAEAALFQARAELARARYDEIRALVARARALGRLDRQWLRETLEGGT